MTLSIIRICHFVTEILLNKILSADVFTKTSIGHVRFANETKEWLSIYAAGGEKLSGS